MLLLAVIAGGDQPIFGSCSRPSKAAKTMAVASKNCKTRISLSEILFNNPHDLSLQLFNVCGASPAPH